MTLQAVSSSSHNTMCEEAGGPSPLRPKPSSPPLPPEPLGLFSCRSGLLQTEHKVFFSQRDTEKITSVPQCVEVSRRRKGKIKGFWDDKNIFCFGGKQEEVWEKTIRRRDCGSGLQRRVRGDDKEIGANFKTLHGPSLSQLFLQSCANGKKENEKALFGRE